MTPHVTAAGAPGLVGAPLRTYAVGDIHGRLDVLTEALGLIEAEEPVESYRVVFLGDYIDRGPDSAGVIARLRQGPARPGVEWICLRGNHEDLAVSSGKREQWMRNGGDATLASYENLDPACLEDDRRWMASLPLWFDDGLRLYVHAGVNPDLDLDGQDPQTLTWVRHAFLEAAGFRVDRHVVHGHTPQWAGKPDRASPETLPHRTNLDVKAYRTGLLAIGVFDPEAPGGPIGFLRAAVPESAVEGPPKSSALSQTQAFNRRHRIEAADRIRVGFRDGGRGLQFDDQGQASGRASREVLELFPVDQDPELRDAVETAKARTAASPDRLSKAEALTDLVIELMGENSPQKNWDLMASMADERGVQGMVVPIGWMIRAGTGVCRHRSLLFKVLADAVDLPAALVRGNYIRRGVEAAKGEADAIGGHAWNEVVLETGERLLVDTMHGLITDFGDPVVASYFDVDNVPMYEPKAPDPQFLAAVSGSANMALIGRQPWAIGQVSGGGRAWLLGAAPAGTADLQTLQAALTAEGIRYDMQTVDLVGSGPSEMLLVRNAGALRLRGASNVRPA